MDMARKFLQMGYTQARRYTNHKGGRKYSKEDGSILPYQNEPVKADTDYVKMMKQHRENYESEED